VTTKEEAAHQTASPRSNYQQAPSLPAAADRRQAWAETLARYHAAEASAWAEFCDLLATSAAPMLAAKLWGQWPTRPRKPRRERLRKGQMGEVQREIFHLVLNRYGKSISKGTERVVAGMLVRGNTAGEWCGNVGEELSPLNPPAGRGSTNLSGHECRKTTTRRLRESEALGIGTLSKRRVPGPQRYKQAFVFRFNSRVVGTAHLLVLKVAHVRRGAMEASSGKQAGEPVRRSRIPSWREFWDGLEIKPSKRNGKGWMMNCPAHDDRHPSLAITEGENGKWLAHCHADCTFTEVCAAFGFPAPGERPDFRSSTPGAQEPAVVTLTRRPCRTRNHPPGAVPFDTRIPGEAVVRPRPVSRSWGNPPGPVPWDTRIAVAS